MAKKDVKKAEQASEALAPPVVTSEALAVDSADEWDFGEDARKGFIGLTRDEMSIPFWGLLQSNSDVVKKKEIPGAEGGLFVNSMTKELTDKLIIQPVLIDRVFVEWAPRGSDKKTVGRYKFIDDFVQKAIARNNGSIYGSKDKPFYSGNDKNTLRDTRYLYFQRLAEDGLTVIGFGIMSFASTKIRKLTDATSAIDQSGLRCPLWSGRFVMTAFLDNRAGEDFHNVDLKAFGRDNLIFDKTNLLPPVPENPSDNWVPSPKQRLYMSGKELEASILGGQHKADYDGEHVDAGGGSGESVDSAGAGKRHF